MQSADCAVVHSLAYGKKGTLKSFGMILSSLRKETGLSQRQAAFDLGISQALLSHYENGAREPKLEFVVKACDYYDVSADYILGRNAERGSRKPLLTDVLSSALCGLQELKSAADLLIEKFENLAENDKGS